MATSKRTGAVVRLVVVLAIAIALVSAARGAGPTDPTSSAGRVLRSATQPAGSGSKAVVAGSNIPGGPLVRCEGDLVRNQTVSGGGNTINLKLFQTSKVDGGRSCAMATKIADTSRRPGPLVTTLQLVDATAPTWPQFAEHRSSTTAVRFGGVYLDHTDNRCVRAEVTFTPAKAGPALVASASRTDC